MIVILVGLPGSGKSTLANRLAADMGGAVIDKDRVRIALFPQEFIEYSARQDDVCQSVMLMGAEYLLTRHPHLVVFLDGRTFSRTYQIENAIRTAESIAQPWRILYCVCSEETARRRLEEDCLSGVHPAKNRDFQLYQTVQQHFEAVARPHSIVDTDRPLESSVAQAREYLGRM